jgi:hypothetical protein
LADLLFESGQVVIEVRVDLDATEYLFCEFSVAGRGGGGVLDDVVDRVLDTEKCVLTERTLFEHASLFDLLVRRVFHEFFLQSS